MKKLIIYIVLVFITVANVAYGQDKGYEYVVILKNGITLRGQFIKKDANGFITLRNPEKGIISINPAEISYMQREEIPANAPYVLQNTTLDGDFGFQIAPGAMIGMTDETESGFQIQGVGFLWLNSSVALGAGAGFERVNHASWIPLFGQVRIDAGVPFIAVDLGYTSLLDDSNYNFKHGGLMAAAEFGVKFPTSNGLTFFLSTTYRYQRASMEEMVYMLEQPVSSDIYPPIYSAPFNTDLDYHFLVLSAGIIF